MALGNTEFNRAGVPPQHFAATVRPHVWESQPNQKTRGNTETDPAVVMQQQDPSGDRGGWAKFGSVKCLHTGWASEGGAAIGRRFLRLEVLVETV